MGNLKNTITINGKTYDVRSGQTVPIEPKSTTSQHGSLPKHAKRIHPRQQVSDIIRPTKSANTTNISASHTKQRSVSNSATVASNPSQDKARKHIPAKPSYASVNPAKRKTHKANTLARNYVQKPVVKQKTEANSTPKIVSLHSSVDHNRLHRARKVVRSHNVSRFGSTNHKVSAKQVDHIAVVPEPKKHKQPYSIEDIPPHPTALKHKTKHKSTSHSGTDHKKSQDLFESALKSSKSHQQTYSHHKKSPKRRSKLVGSLALSLTAVLLIAFFVYQNIPTIAVYTTSSKVGFQVAKPSYQPAGFGLKGPLQYEQGKVVLDFRSNSDDKKYSIEQTKTELDSASMLNNYLTASNTDYSTEYANGRTVYIYGNNNATWVDGGIWYKLTNDANLNSEQLLKIVSSI